MILEKTKELGKLILETDEYKNVKKSKEEFLDNEKAVKMMEEYNKKEQEIQKKMMNQELNEKEFQEEINNLKKMAEKLKENDAIANLLKSENTFNNLMNEVLAVLKASLGDIGSENEHAHNHENCQGCGHHH